MPGTAVARGLGWSGASVQGSRGWLQRAGARGPLFLGRILPEEETSLGYLASPEYKGLGWVLEVEGELVKNTGHGTQRGSTESMLSSHRPW